MTPPSMRPDEKHIFLAPDGGVKPSLMPDFEHPNEAGHRAWASPLEPLVAQLMGDKPFGEMGPNQSNLRFSEPVSKHEVMKPSHVPCCQLKAWHLR